MVILNFYLDMKLNIKKNFVYLKIISTFVKINIL